MQIRKAPEGAFFKISHISKLQPNDHYLGQALL